MLEEFEKRWENLNYNKHSESIHWIEWSIAIPILFQSKQELVTVDEIIYWVLSSATEYPRLPNVSEETENYIQEYLEAFYKAKILVSELHISEYEIKNCKNKKLRRCSIAKIANKIEYLLLKKGFEKHYARFAGDIFIRISIPEEFAF